MNAAPFSSLSADHQRLQALGGAWRGEEEVAGTQWTDAGVGKAVEEIHIITHIMAVYLCGDEQ